MNIRFGDLSREILTLE